MCLKPALVRPLSPEIVAWAARHLPPESPYPLVGEQPYAQFTDLYLNNG